MATYFVPEVPFTGGTWVTNDATLSEMASTEVAQEPKPKKRASTRNKKVSEVPTEDKQKQQQEPKESTGEVV